MNKEKVQKLICKLELVLDGLKEELLSDTNSLQQVEYENVVPFIDDYDEIFYGDS